MKLFYLLCFISFINLIWFWFFFFFYFDVSIVLFIILFYFNVVNIWNKLFMVYVYWAKNELLCILNYSSKVNNFIILIESIKKFIVFLLEF